MVTTRAVGKDYSIVVGKDVGEGSPWARPRGSLLKRITSRVRNGIRGGIE